MSAAATPLKLREGKVKLEDFIGALNCLYETLDNPVDTEVRFWVDDKEGLELEPTHINATGIIEIGMERGKLQKHPGWNHEITIILKHKEYGTEEIPE